MKYKLINKQTKEEHICQKVTIDGFDYYVSDNHINKLKPDDAYHTIVENPRRVVRYTKHIQDTTSGVIICTNNPNIDIPKVVDEVKVLANLHKVNISEDWSKASFIKGYNKSQETHSFSEEDMIEFANWIGEEWSPNGRKECWDSNELNSTHEPKYLVDGTKELLQIWKKQKPKIVYYE